jgi:hypothetical protein
MRIIMPALGLTCALLCSTAAVAQRYSYDAARTRVTANQIVDQFDAEIAKLKAMLRLTPDQDKNWGGFQSAIHDMASARANAQFERRDAIAKRDRDARDANADNRDAPAVNRDAAAPGDKPVAPAAQDMTGSTRDDGAMAAMRAKADEYADMSTNLKKLADALNPLYGTLDNRQRAEVIRFVRKDFTAMYQGGGDWGGDRGRRDR